MTWREHGAGCEPQLVSGPGFLPSTPSGRDWRTHPRSPWAPGRNTAQAALAAQHSSPCLSLALVPALALALALAHLALCRPFAVAGLGQKRALGSGCPGMETTKGALWEIMGSGCGDLRTVGSGEPGEGSELWGRDLGSPGRDDVD